MEDIHLRGNNEIEKSTDIIIKPPIIVPEKKKISFLDFLSKLSPGKHLRTALDDIVSARDGALIVIYNDKMKNLFEGGFRVNCKFSSQRLAELAKMDGAIILSEDLRKILFANTLLVPDTGIQTDETGTRHKAAERTSIQAETPVIAVSERKAKISLFYDNKKYVLHDSEILLRKATENLYVLEKQKEILNELKIHLNILEITNLTSIGDICSILQRTEMMSRVMNTLRRTLIELGSEGVTIQMRTRELFRGVEELKEAILKDYTDRPTSSLRILSSINFDMLLDTNNIARTIFEKDMEYQVYPRGYRILGKLNLTEREIQALINNFSNIKFIMEADDDSLRVIMRAKFQSFKKDIEILKEQIMAGNKV